MSYPIILLSLYLFLKYPWKNTLEKCHNGNKGPAAPAKRNFQWAEVAFLPTLILIASPVRPDGMPLLWVFTS